MSKCTIQQCVNSHFYYNVDFLMEENGEYDDPFTPGDLKLWKQDIQKVKEYLAQHPELL